MDYKKHYDLLITRAGNRVLCGYKEIHHIIPKCMGGTDDKTNLVALTAEEHYLAHQLLVKIYPSNHKLIYAANMMSVSSADTTGRSNKRYGWLKRKQSEAMSGENHPMYGKHHTDETKEKIRIAGTGRKLSSEHIQIIKETHTGKVVSQSTRDKLREANLGEKSPMYGKPKSAETKAKMSAAAIGKPKSVEARANMSKAQKGKPSPHKGKKRPQNVVDKVSESLRNLPDVECPYCGITGHPSNMGRWHFDKCKYKSMSPDVIYAIKESGGSNTVKCPHCDTTFGLKYAMSHHFDKCKHRKESK